MIEVPTRVGRTVVFAAITSFGAVITAHNIIPIHRLPRCGAHGAAEE